MKMPIKSIRDLYICKTWEQLVAKADEGAVSRSNAKNLIQTVAKLYEEGKKADSGGDEERAYILFHRFFTSIKTVKKSEDYKKDEKYYSNMIGMNKVKEVVERMEALATSLIKRYDLLKEINELTERELNGTVNSVSINNSNSNDLNETKKPKSIETVDESDYPLIDCQTLVESLENTTEMNKILILDTRTPEEYSVSHIDKLRTTADLNVVNIPQNLLIPGLTSSKLESDLPLGNTLDVFKRRRSMSKVIIADLHSHEVIANTPAFHLAEALWKWDISSLKLKNKPFLLKGGYADWVLTYPMFTSNPKYISKNLPLNANKSLNLGFNYDLSEFEDKPKTPNNLVVNGFTNGDIEEDTQSQKGSEAEQQANRVNHIFNTRPTNVAIPGTAKPLIPDRSTKPRVQPEMSSSNEPNIEEKEVKEDVEKIKLRKVNEINEQLMESMREDFDGKIQLLNNQLNNKNKENKNLMETIRKAKPPSLVSNDLNDTNDEKPVIAINGETNGLNKRNAIYMKVDDSGDNNTTETDLTNGVMNGHRMSNSITSTHKGVNKSSNSLSVSSNLSRSISSPNIAQLLEKEMNGKHMDNMDTNEGKERSMTTPSQPQFDRTLKPAINREKLYFNDSTVIEDKVRDFCPVRSGGTSITGLKNLGNTCYSNAVVQCLLNTTEFSSFFSRNLKINKNSKYGSNGELVLELAALFRHMAYPSFYTMLSAKDFRQAVSKHIKDFVPGAQQDSHEFLVKLFEKLHDDLNESTKWDVINTGVSEGLSLDARAMKFWKQHMSKNNSIISQLFEGLIVNTLTCLKCDEKSDSFEVFSCLSLPIGNSRTTLTECLNQYFKPERMSGETAWECPTCKQKREADKRLRIWKLPKILIVHLKRFSIEGRYKLRTYVDFPMNDLPMRTIQSANPIQYSLYGVVNHFGTLEGGHYTAFSHNQSKYRWHKFDDQDVTQTNPADVKSENAYILFYRCC